MSAGDAAHRGPAVRTDVVDVYVARRVTEGDTTRIEFLQLLRAEEPLKGTWHPVMGHIAQGESALRCAARELHEETGLASGDQAMRGAWALEQVHPFYIASLDVIVMSPRFLVEVSPRWQPVLNAEHSNHRWVPAIETSQFMWPGQRAAVQEAVRILSGAPEAQWLRVDLK